MPHFGSLKYRGTETEEKGARGAGFVTLGGARQQRGFSPSAFTRPHVSLLRLDLPEMTRDSDSFGALRLTAARRPNAAVRHPVTFALSQIFCVYYGKIVVVLWTFCLSPYILLPIPTCVTAASQPPLHLCPGARCVGARFSCRGKAPTQKRAPTRKCA